LFRRSFMVCVSSSCGNTRLTCLHLFATVRYAHRHSRGHQLCKTGGTVGRAAARELCLPESKVTGTSPVHPFP
jgi:hypothetical protein